jgi:uncharacterized protein
VKVRRTLTVGLIVLLSACAGTDRDSQTGVGADASSAPSAALRIGSTVITLEIARSAEERAIGLSGRAELADDKGMLFVYDEPRVVTFWMRGMLIPIDMVFLRSDVVVEVIADVPPCREDPCPTYGPDVPVDSVLELASGRSATLGIASGMTVSISER